MVVRGLILGGKSSAALMVVAAASGIMTSMLDAAGLGIKFTYLAMALSDGSRLNALLLIAAVTLILGLGLPITASYLAAAALGVPLLVDLGFSVIGSHMFVLYYAAISAVTPPVAFTAFAAASIARTSAWMTGWQAMRIGFVGYIAPFLFIERPALLILGAGPLAILAAAVPAILGLLAITVGFVGHFRRPIGAAQCILLAAAGSALSLLNWGVTDLVAGAVIVTFLALQFSDRFAAPGADPVSRPSGAARDFAGRQEQ